MPYLGQDEISFQTYAVCYSQDEMAVLGFVCDSDELIIINKAFDGKKAIYKAPFCEHPQPGRLTRKTKVCTICICQ